MMEETIGQHITTNLLRSFRVTTDNAFPYRIYGAQQDNSTIRIAHRTSGSSIERVTGNQLLEVKVLI